MVPDIIFYLWMEWFLGCLGRAIADAQRTLSSIFAKTKFWDRIKETPLNEQQRLVLNRLLDGFGGKLTNAKYAVLAKCSHDTAFRDIQQLVERGTLMRGAEGGRSTRYSLANEGPE